MRERFLIVSILAFIAFECSGCSSKKNDDEIEKDVTEFATAYFNYDFEVASKYCTPESERWLRYASSNVHEADVEVLRNASEGASIKVDDIIYNDDDSTGYACITVNNYLRIDTIGKAGRMIDEGKFKLPMILRNNKWTVRMEGLPRSEKPNHGSN